MYFQQKHFPKNPIDSPVEYNVLIPEDGYGDVYKIVIKFKTYKSREAFVYNLYALVCHLERKYQNIRFDFAFINMLINYVILQLPLQQPRLLLHHLVLLVLLILPLQHHQYQVCTVYFLCS